MIKRLFCLFLIVCVCFTLPITTSAIEIIGSIDADDNATLIAPTLTISSTPENAMGVAYNFQTQTTHYYDLWGDLAELNPNATSFKAPGYVPTMLDNGNVVSPNIVSGPDERFPAESTNQYPFRVTALVVAEYSIDEGTYYVTNYGTATMIGPSVALTAAHCVYSSEYGWPDVLTIYPGIYGSSASPQLPFGINSVGEAIEVVVSVPYYQDYSLYHDWALIRLSEPIGYHSGYLGFENAPAGELVTELYDPWYILTGYPRDLNHNYSTYTQYAGSGVIIDDAAATTMTSNGVTYPFRSLQHTMDTSDGQSGAALLRLDETATGAYVIVGIHSRGNEEQDYNTAVGIEYQLFSFMLAYRYT